MRLGESRQDSAKRVLAAHQLVRGWVWLYTLGLPLQARNDRRTEIDSDLWDQTHTWRVRRPSTSGDASSVLLRCLRGMPADLIWRFADTRTRRSSAEGRPAMLTFTMRSSVGRATIILMAVLVVATIEWDNPDTRIMEPWLKIVLGFLLLGVGLVLTVRGLGLIRRAPWLGAVLTVSGTWMVALLVYWLWYPVPLLIAAGVSVFAIGWAKRRREADARQEVENE